MGNIRWPGQVIDHIEQAERDNEAGAGYHEGQGLSMPEPQKPAPEVVHYYIEFAAIDFQVVPIHFGILGHNRVNRAIGKFVTQNAVGSITGALINQSRASQANHQDNNTKEIKEFPGREDFPIHARSGLTALTTRPINPGRPPAARWLF